MTLNGLDLFSGIGGITLALAPWVRPMVYCENDKFAQAVLLSRMARGDLPRAPIWDDVTTLRGDRLPPIDIVYGGFPCQDISVAGHGRGLKGERSGLVFEVFRLVSEVKPALVFLENVPAIRTRGGERVGKELAALGYDCRWDTLAASAVGAPHKRERWWLIAYSECRELWDQPGRSGRAQRACETSASHHGGKGPLADTDGTRLEVRRVESARQQRAAAQRSGETHYPNRERLEERPQSRGLPATHGGKDMSEEPGQNSADQPFHANWWAAEPDVGRMAHGVPSRVDRLKSLGNAVVPAQAREAFKRLTGAA